MTPTQRHYLISAVAGALLAAIAAASTYLVNGQPFSWPLLGAAVAGGVVLFARDWLHNNTGAFLEGTAPAVVASAAAAPPPPAPVPISTPKPAGP